MNWILGLTALANVLCAILAWVAKIRWSKEYKEAKEAQIEVLKTELENLRQFTPMKLREYYLTTKESLEEFNDNLKTELAEEKKRVGVKGRKIAELEEKLKSSINVDTVLGAFVDAFILGKPKGDVGKIVVRQWEGEEKKWVEKGKVTVERTDD